MSTPAGVVSSASHTPIPAEPKLTAAQQIEVKKVARDLLAALHDKVAVFQWRQRQQSSAVVRVAIEQTLNHLPAEPYPKDLWDMLVTQTWDFVFVHAAGQFGGTANLPFSTRPATIGGRCGCSSMVEF